MACQAVPLGAADAVIYDLASGGLCTLYGYSVDPGASAAALYLRENSSSGRILATVRLAANVGATVFFDDGVQCRGDLYEDTITGTYTGCAYVG